MNFLAALIPFRWYAIGAVGLALGIWIGALKVDVALLERANALLKKALAAALVEVQTEKDGREAERKSAEALATKKVAEANARIAILVANEERNLRELASVKDRIHRISVELADARRVRDEAIAAYARGRTPASAAISAEDRAEALGRVLQEALRTAEELAIDAESNAADARALSQSRDAILNAWPR